MTSDRLARDYLRRARDRRAALETLMAHGAHADVVRESQDLVELVLKGALRFVGVDPPKRHDVHGVMARFLDRFPGEWREARTPRPRACGRLGPMPRRVARALTVDDAPDPIEELYARGVTDGLPAVPPTPARVARAIAGAGRDAGELIGLVPPNYGRATVERIAVNAVMAGCRPEYLPVVIAGVEALCDEAFNFHGASATTNFAAPLFIVNGPIRLALDVNCGAGAFGPGWRANATIGRALSLIALNVGGARPGVVSLSTLSHPGKYTYCIGENEEASPWPSLAVEHGFATGESTVAAVAGEAPHGVYDHASRTAPDLLATIARSLEVISHHKSTHHGDTLLVLSPEHARTLADDGWDKSRIRAFLHERLQKPVCELVPGRDGGEGLPEHVLRKFADPQRDQTRIPKFRSADHIKIVVVGGAAGRFSAVIPGWTFPKSSNLVIKRIQEVTHG